MKYKDNKNKRGFTLIELIAVLVIMAIIALIATPLVMNIVKKAKDSANKRSIDAYGKAVELAVATHLLDTGDYPTSLDNLTVEYSGNEVVCNIQKLNEDGSIYLSECSVKDVEVKDSSSEDGWYHYGKSSSTTYQSYKIGDVVTYNGMNFYVIEASDSTSDRVALLKETPLTVDEVNTYGGVGTENNHVNMYVNPTWEEYQTAYNYNGYGGMAYYTSEICGHNGTDLVYDGCITDYVQSEVKYVVDAWVNDKLNTSDLIEDSIGYKIRLITVEEIMENSEKKQVCTGSCYEELFPVYEWLYNGSYSYWTMSPYEDSASTVWRVGGSGDIVSGYVNSGSSDFAVVRPVITLLKSAI